MAGHACIARLTTADRIEWLLLQVRLTWEQARQSPNADADLPVARRQILEAATQALVSEVYWAKIPDLSSAFELARFCGGLPRNRATSHICAK